MKASVIIVNYNGEDIVRDCLRAVEDQSFGDFEVLFVDNGSSDNSVETVRKFSEGAMTRPIRVIPLERNAGFTGGNLAALACSEAEYVALLNNDAEPGRDWLGSLVAVMDAHGEAGICASKMIASGACKIDSAGDGYSTALRGFKRAEGENRDKCSTQEYVFGACAGAALYRRKMLDDIGFLDEDFFLIHEDTDLNFRAQLAGWKVLYVPSALVYHKVGSTIGHLSDMAVYYTLRNSEFVRIKNVPLSIFLECLPSTLFAAFSEFVYFAVKHRKFRPYMSAKIDVLRKLRVMLRKRREVMKMRRVDDAYVRGLMTSVWNRAFFGAKVKKFLYD